MSIFDVVMSGDRAANSIREIKPGVKIIISTGYDKKLQTRIGSKAVLSKPFSIGEMSHLIRQQLDSG